MAWYGQDGGFAMLTGVTIRNFKMFDDVSVELGRMVVCVGPNNSGKTTALQALALWQIGLRACLAKWGGDPPGRKRSGVSITRRDLIALPVPETKMLWRNLKVRRSHRGDGQADPQHLRIDILVEGIARGRPWQCGLEFDFANDQSFYCRPLRVSDGKPLERMLIPPEARDVRVAFLPPMSGLAAVEPRLEPGRVDVLIGEGQTAQVLRNMCHRIAEQPDLWEDLTERIRGLFGVDLLPPVYDPGRGEIYLHYRTRDQAKLDISSAGRGFQQCLLLLCHLYANPGSVLLLDEPDAHLEILRQRQIYQTLIDLAQQHDSQIVAASHSEVMLTEAAERDIVIAFVGRPHRLDNRGHHNRGRQVLKALKTIDHTDYYLAEQRGWVLYLEGATDLKILRTWARRLDHPAQMVLERPFVVYVRNDPRRVIDHLWGLREAKPDLVAAALFDNLGRPFAQDVTNTAELTALMWQRREIENYLCCEDVLIEFAHGQPGPDLFDIDDAKTRVDAMRAAIAKVADSLQTLHQCTPWDPQTKVTDHFLNPLFDLYFKTLGLPNQMRKTNYHVLADWQPADQIDGEVRDKLDAIRAVADAAHRAGED